MIHIAFCIHMGFARKTDCTRRMSVKKSAEVMCAVAPTYGVIMGNASACYRG